MFIISVKIADIVLLLGRIHLIYILPNVILIDIFLIGYIADMPMDIFAQTEAGLRCSKSDLMAISDFTLWGYGFHHISCTHSKEGGMAIITRKNVGIIMQYTIQTQII